MTLTTKYGKEKITLCQPDERTFIINTKNAK